MLKCQQIAEQASAYVDKEMGPLQRMRYRFHLVLCANCRRFVANFSRGIEMVRRLSKPQISEQQLDAVHRRVDTAKRS